MSGLTPGFIVALLIFSFWILCSSKEGIIIPLIVAMCFLPGDLSVKLGTLDFQALRVMALVSAVTLIAKGADPNIKYNSIDKLFFSYNIIGFIAYTIASPDHFNAFVYKVGFSIDSILLYIVFKNIIQSTKSIRLICKTLAICILFLLPFIFNEYFSANNLFSFLGRNAISMRDGEIRVACTFSHAILFGSFAAAIFPLVFVHFLTHKNIVYLHSIFCCIFAVFASASSGPILALTAVFCLLFLFKKKQHSKLIAKCILIASIFIHFAREKSFWHFIYVRIAIKASSTGHHRYMLTEAARKEFWNWCFIGYGSRGADWHTKYWPYIGASFTDFTNQYLLEGARGGFMPMVLLIVLCYKVVKSTGTLAILHQNKEKQWLWWGTTVMMLAHCISFLSVAYFGQITMLFLISIAIGSLAYNKLGDIQPIQRETEEQTI